MLGCTAVSRCDPIQPPYNPICRPQNPVAKTHHEAPTSGLPNTIALNGQARAQLREAEAIEREAGEGQLMVYGYGFRA